MGNHLRMMIAGGNVRAHAYFNQYAVGKDILVKYRSQAATHYRLALKAQAEEMDFSDKPPSVLDGTSPDTSLYPRAHGRVSPLSSEEARLLGRHKTRKEGICCVVL